MYSILNNNYLYSAKLMKERNKDRQRDRKKETLFWLITRYHGLRHSLGGWKLQCLRANPVTNNLLSNIDFAQCMN